MIGDKLTYHNSFKSSNIEVISKLRTKFLKAERLCIAIGGESGSGKTSLAYTLCLDVEKEFGIKGFLFHADDYFFLPPKDNHNKRLKDISKAGVSEVNLNQLDSDLASFLNTTKILKKPLINYDENNIGEEIVCTKDYDFCIVEGTYTMLLDAPIFKIFITNSFNDTKENRIKRGRDILNNFNEKVLEIEHQIIKQHIKYADMAIKNYID